MTSNLHFRSVGADRVMRLRLVAAAVAVVVLGGCGAKEVAPTNAAPTNAAPTNADPTNADPTSAAPVDMSEVKTFTGLSQDHTEAPVKYPQTPPVGGDHNPAWQNCGVYTEAVPNELGVHSMEHGAVWINYRPDLSAAAVATLGKFANGRTHVLVSPVEGLGSMIVLSAWGFQLDVETPDDSRIGEFISTYEQGPQTPEPGAPCSGGLGSPE